MHPKQVELLAARIRENRRTSVNSTKAIMHIEAVHTKLVHLQTIRRQMKVKLAELSAVVSGADGDDAFAGGCLHCLPHGFGDGGAFSGAVG